MPSGFICRVKSRKDQNNKLHDKLCLHFDCTEQVKLQTSADDSLNGREHPGQSIGPIDFQVGLVHLVDIISRTKQNKKNPDNFSFLKGCLNMLKRPR